MDAAAPLPMAPALQSLGRRIALIAAIAGIAMLGDLRAAVSHPAQGSLGWEPSPVAPSTPASVDAVIAATTGDPEDAAPAPAATSPQSTLFEDGRLIPAIYAWDPDVRFVYFRHVSKWM